MLESSIQYSQNIRICLSVLLFTVLRWGPDYFWQVPHVLEPPACCNLVTFLFFFSPLGIPEQVLLGKKEELDLLILCLSRKYFRESLLEGLKVECSRTAAKTNDLRSQ